MFKLIAHQFKPSLPCDTSQKEEKTTLEKNYTLVLKYAKHLSIQLKESQEMLKEEKKASLSKIAALSSEITDLEAKNTRLREELAKARPSSEGRGSYQESPPSSIGSHPRLRRSLSDSSLSSTAPFKEEEWEKIARVSLDQLYSPRPHMLQTSQTPQNSQVDASTQIDNAQLGTVLKSTDALSSHTYSDNGAPHATEDPEDNRHSSNVDSRSNGSVQDIRMHYNRHTTTSQSPSPQTPTTPLGGKRPLYNDSPQSPLNKIPEIIMDVVGQVAGCRSPFSAHKDKINPVTEN